LGRDTQIGDGKKTGTRGGVSEGTGQKKLGGNKIGLPFKTVGREIETAGLSWLRQ